MSGRTDNEGLAAHIVVRRGETFNLDVELDIDPGTTVALLGPNGSGKSTTVEVLAGLLPLDRGQITLAGRVLDDPSQQCFVEPQHRRVGVVFQQYLLFEHMTVRDNIAFGPQCRGLGRGEARAAAQTWLDRLDLVDLASRRPSELSGGQAQRVALARTLAADPEVLLLDEPLAALDIATRTSLRRTLASHLQHYRGPRLLITHDPTDAFLLADRICVIEGGRISQTGTPDDIRMRPATTYVAALAGLNLLNGVNSGGVLTIEGVDQRLQSADTQTDGSVLITIAPNAIALHSQQPHGSPRNAWPTSIATIEPLGDITRIMLGDPLRLSVDITPGAASSMGLRQGSSVWASVKATEVNLNPA